MDNAIKWLFNCEKYSNLHKMLVHKEIFIGKVLHIPTEIMETDTCGCVSKCSKFNEHTILLHISCYISVAIVPHGIKC